METCRSESRLLLACVWATILLRQDDDGIGVVRGEMFRGSGPRRISATST
ncbi:hypothetical protein M758_4G171300 [Ceratodon purpureus]|nr:hypothetical protein M758_4G171300 [Ceratodon purpureus]